MTRSIVSMSIPRLKISVATITGMRPLVKPPITLSLCACSRSLCISSIENPACFKVRANCFTFCLRLQKINALLYGVLFSKCFTNGNFCSSCTTKAFCTIFSGGLEIAILISAGSCKILRASCRIFGGMVAENNNV